MKFFKYGSSPFQQARFFFNLSFAGKSRLASVFLEGVCVLGWRVLTSKVLPFTCQVKPETCLRLCLDTESKYQIFQTHTEDFNMTPVVTDFVQKTIFFNFCTEYIFVPKHLLNLCKSVSTIITQIFILATIPICICLVHLFHGRCLSCTVVITSSLSKKLNIILLEVYCCTCILTTALLCKHQYSQIA